MAPAFVASVGTAVASAAGTTLGVSPAANVPAGETLLLLLATNGAVGELASCADNSAQGGPPNSYGYVLTRAGNAGGNLAQHVFMCQTTRLILTTDTITVTVPTASRRALTVQRYTGFISPAILKIGASLLTTGTSIAPNSMIPRDDPTDAIHVMTCADNTQTLAGLGSPSNGFTMRATALTAGGTVDKAALLADRTPAAVGVTNTSVAETNTTGWSAIMFAVEEGYFASNQLNPNRRNFQSA
jgi:hypothetical protein